MANTFKLKQSAVSAKTPTTAQLQLGELAVNTYDGRLFTKKNVSGTESIIEFVSNSGTWGISINGNAATATTLQTGRTINGTSFNGSANITTASWGTTRTLTIGNTGKSVDGSAAVSWSLAEIGALQHWYESRTLPIVVNDCVDIGTFDVSAGAIALRVSISVSDSGFSTAQIYDIVGIWAASAGWAIVTPIAGNTSYAGNSIRLEAQDTGSSLLLRIRRTAGTTAGTAAISIANTAKTGTTFTASTTVTAAAPAVTAYFPGSGLQIDAATATWRGDALLTVAGGTLTGNITAPRLISNVAQGTAPLGVTSTTVCTNLNADLLDGYHVGTSGGTIPLLNAANTWGQVQRMPCLCSDDPALTRHVIFRDLAQYTASSISTTTGALVIVLGRAVSVGTFYSARIVITGAYQREITVEAGGYFKSDNTWASEFAATTHETLLSVQFARTPEGWPCVILANNANPVASAWINYIRCRIDTLTLGWYGADSADNLNPAYYTTSAVTDLTGYTLDTAVTPTLSALPGGGGTLTGALTLTNTNTALLVHNASTSPTAMFRHDGTNFHLLLSDAGSAPSSTYNALRPFSVHLTTGLVSFRQGVKVDSAWDGATGNGALALDNATANRIDWRAAGVGAPTTSTRSEGTKAVLYPALGASTVDYAFGYNTNTFWTSIPQQTGRCFKQYAGTTPIAALHGDGTPFVYQSAPVTQDTSATLTAAQIRNGLVTSTPTAAITLTLPTGANTTDTLWDANLAIDWSVINLATDVTRTVTLASGDTHAVYGNAIVAANSSARFRTYNTGYEQNGNPVFATYRIS